jgi:glucans biosynthesis protein C
MMEKTQNVRFHSIDALRGIAMLMGIYVHATHSFFIAEWAGVQDTQQSVALPVSYFVIHLFRLPAFFVVAGFFAHLLYHRDGPFRMLVQRSKRILLPAVLGMVTLVPLFHIVQIYGRSQRISPGSPMPWDKVVYYFSSGEFFKHYYPHYLWFLFYLMMLYLLFVMVRPVALHIDGLIGLRERADRFVRFVSSSKTAPWLLALPTALAMVFMESPMIDEPGLSRNVIIGPLLLYGLFFGFGWLLHRQSQCLYSIRDKWKANLVTGLVIFAILAGAAGAMAAYSQGAPDGRDDSQAAASQGFQPPPPPTDPAIFVEPQMPLLSDLPREAQIVVHGARTVLSVAMWALTLAVIGIFVRFFENPSPAFRYVSDSAYWLYLAHLPILMFVQIQIAFWPIHWILKILIIHVAVLPILFVTYHYLVRPTWIGVMLNGRRYPRRQPEAAVIPG